MGAERRDEDKPDDAIGALWAKRSASGMDMLTGNINGVDIVCFPAKRTSDKSPTWRCLKSRPRPETSSPRNPRLPVGRDAREDDSDDVPF